MRTMTAPCCSCGGLGGCHQLRWNDTRTACWMLNPLRFRQCELLDIQTAFKWRLLRLGGDHCDHARVRRQRCAFTASSLLSHPLLRPLASHSTMKKWTTPKLPVELSQICTLIESRDCTLPLSEYFHSNRLEGVQQPTLGLRGPV